MQEFLELTFDFLLFLITNVLGDLHSVANQRITTSMMHGPFNCRIELNDIHRQSGALGEAAELVVDRFDFDGIQRNEGGLSGPLISQVLHQENVEDWPDKA